MQAQVPRPRPRWPAKWFKVVQALRELDLKKRPSVSETLDWARALAILNADELDEKSSKETLNLVLKYEGDIERAIEKLSDLSRAAEPAERREVRPQAAP